MFSPIDDAKPTFSQLQQATQPPVLDYVYILRQFRLPQKNTAVINLYADTHPFNGPLSGTTWVGQYQKGGTNPDFTEARDSEWQWHHLGHMQACTLLQTDNHASNSPLSFLQAGCPSCRPTNSVKALTAKICMLRYIKL